MRELVGDDGQAIAEYMFSVMTDERAKTADRLEAAKWLADRGFGKPVQAVDLDVTATRSIDVGVISTPDLQALIAILENYAPDAGHLITSGNIELR